MIKSIAVTGSTGFVGRHLVKHLVDKNYWVRCLTRGINSQSLKQLPIDRADICKVDWKSKESIRKALQGVDAIVHAAAIHPARSMQNREALLQFNVEGTRKLLESIDSVDRFIMVSSIRTLINTSRVNRVFDENAIYGFREYDTPYGYSKYLSEKLCMKFMEEKGLPLITVNPTSIIGSGDIGPSPNGQFIRGLLKSPIVFMVDTTYSFVDVRDVASAIEKSLNRGEIGQRYPLCAANWPLRTFIKRVHETAGISRPIVPIPIPLAYLTAVFFEGMEFLKPDITIPIVRSSVHIAKLKPIFDGSRVTKIGFTYTDPEETLKETVKWLLENYP